LGLVPSLFLMPVIQQLPVFTEEVLHSGANVYGYLMSAFGVGGLLATLALASFGGAIRSGLLGILALVMGGILAIVFSQSTVLGLSMALVAGLGFTQMTFRVNNNTLVQSLAPDELRGRVMSIYELDHAFMPLSSFILGIAAQVYSAPNAVAVSGMLCLLAIAALMFGIKRMRDVRSLRA